MATIETPKDPKYIDYLSRYKKEAAYFENEYTASGKKWPRIKPVEERGYDNWIAEVVDPVTGEYYTDIDGNPARYYIDKLVRLKRVDGSEVLYSIGQLVGFDSFKDEKTYSISKPEVHIRTKFEHQRKLDKKNQIKRVTVGPKGVEEVYDMPFTEENANKLWNMKRDRNIQLILKDELSSEPHLLERKGIIAPNDLEGAFTLFKTAPFDYLYNWEYIRAPTAEKNPLKEQIEKDEQERLTKHAEQELNKAQPDTKTETRFKSEKVK